MVNNTYLVRCAYPASFYYKMQAKTLYYIVFNCNFCIFLRFAPNINHFTLAYEHEKPRFHYGSAENLMSSFDYLRIILKSTTTARSAVTRTGLPSIAVISGISSTSF